MSDTEIGRWFFQGPIPKSELPYKERERLRAARRYAERRRWIASLKHAVGCQICGEDFSAVLEFHHVDHADKALKMSSSISRRDDRLFAEMSKCVLLCGNCHVKAECGLIDVTTLDRIDYAEVAKTMEWIDPPAYHHPLRGKTRSTN